MSSQALGSEVDLTSIVDGSRVDSGVRGGAALLEFAEAALTDDTAVIASARDRVARELGEAAAVDAAGVIANFQRMVRIADATGIPLDAPVVMITQGIRDELGLNDYAAAVNTPALSWPRKIMGRVLQPLVPTLLIRMAKSMRRGSE